MYSDLYIYSNLYNNICYIVIYIIYIIYNLYNISIYVYIVI